MGHNAKAVANCFLDLAKLEGDHTISPLKMQKLVYFAHGWHLGLTGQPAINSPVEAWPFGPVVPTLYHEFKHFKNNEITEYATELEWGKGGSIFDNCQLIVPELSRNSEESSYAVSLIQKVWEVYKKYTPIQLSNATHAPGTPWEKVNRMHNGQIPKGTAIPNADIREYFAKLAGK